MCVCVCVCVCVCFLFFFCFVFLVLRPLQGYFTVLRVQGNIIQQVTQNNSKEAFRVQKTEWKDNYLFFFFFFCVLVLRPLQDYFTNLRVKKYCSANKQRAFWVQKQNEKIIIFFFFFFWGGGVFFFFVFFCGGGGLRPLQDGKSSFAVQEITLTKLFHYFKGKKLLFSK